MHSLAYGFGFMQRMMRDGRPRSIVDDVSCHLEQLLNVKPGYGSFLADLGLDISDAMWSAKPMLVLAQHMEAVARRYETRLRDVVVTHVDRDVAWCPRFRLDALLEEQPLRLTIALHTANCSVRVTRER